MICCFLILKTLKAAALLHQAQRFVIATLPILLQ